MARLNDLSGSTFGRLVVKRRSKDKISLRGKRQVIWECQCTCGTSCLVAANNLSSGNSSSCGCEKRTPKRLELTGKRFGRLLVKNYSHTTKRGQALWYCVCDCGVISTKRATALLRGKVKSCGCYRAEGRFHKGIGPAKWASLVKAGRDCLKCGAVDNLNAHHIVPVCVDKSLSLSLFNGECLCENCHKEFHSKYGKEKTGIEDFSIFCGIAEEESSVMKTLIYAKCRQDIEKAIHELQLILELRYSKGEG